MQIIFAGTSPFALPALRIVQKNHKIAAVITNPDAQSGRGKKMRPSAVKEAAREYGITVHDSSVDSLYDTLRALHPDLLVVIAYGARIPPDILAIPRFGALNIHPSLLPKYRGASPIQAAILNGDTETGVTIMRITDALDAGPIVAREAIALPGDVTAGELHDMLAKSGAELLRETLKHGPPFEGTLQDESRASYTKKITPREAELNPRESAALLERKVRAYNPWPGAFIQVQNFGRIKIFRVYIKKDAPRKFENASFIIIDKYPAIVCGDGQLLVLTEVQPEGRKRMKGEEFVRGYFHSQSPLCSREYLSSQPLKTR